MRANAMNQRFMSGSLAGAVALVAACASSEGDPADTDATAGSTGAAGSSSGGAGGAAGESGSAASGAGGTSGVAGSSSASGGVPGSGGTSGTGDGGAAHETDYRCIPDIPDVCFGASIETPGVPFVSSAWAFGNEASVKAAEWWSPAEGTVCMSGTDVHGGSLELVLMPGDGVTPFVSLDTNMLPPELTPDQLFHAGTLGILGFSFTLALEIPPQAGLGIRITNEVSGRMGVPVWAAAEQDGNPVIITTSESNQLSLADFKTDDPSLPFDTNAIGQLEFAVGSGPYEFCVSNLKFLGANGDEISPPG